MTQPESSCFLRSCHTVQKHRRLAPCRSQAEAARAIELLRERRTALISAAVTGKIDVREFTSQETT